MKTNKTDNSFILGSDLLGGIYLMDSIRDHDALEIKNEDCFFEIIRNWKQEYQDEIISCKVSYDMVQKLIEEGFSIDAWPNGPSLDLWNLNQYKNMERRIL